MKKYIPVIFLLVFQLIGNAQLYNPSELKFYSIEPVLNIGKIVKNAPIAPPSNTAIFMELNVSVQTSGRKDWHSLYSFPKTGYLFVFGGLGNNKVLGNLFGVVPNMTFNSMSTKWYLPGISLGLGVAYFNKPFNINNNATNYYIGSAFTALGYASVYIQPIISKHISLKTGVSIFHCSNGHIQVPNLGINLPSFSVGITYKPNIYPYKFEKRNIEIPQSGIRFNFRFGLGVHQLARTTEPIGTAKYVIYVTDLYISKLFGKINNVHTGIEIKHYNSFYNYIVRNETFTTQQKLKATVISVFLGHEFMINHISLLSQGGINIFNPFYREYIKQFKSIHGFRAELNKYISTRLGLQYYFRDPKYCTRSNIFIGAYIKANFGQADFICTQVGFMF